MSEQTSPRLEAYAARAKQAHPPTCCGVTTMYGSYINPNHMRFQRTQSEATKILPWADRVKPLRTFAAEVFCALAGLVSLAFWLIALT